MLKWIRYPPDLAIPPLHQHTQSHTQPGHGFYGQKRVCDWRRRWIVLKSPPRHMTCCQTPWVCLSGRKHWAGNTFICSHVLVAWPVIPLKLADPSHLCSTGFWTPWEQCALSLLKGLEWVKSCCLLNSWLAQRWPSQDFSVQVISHLAQSQRYSNITFRLNLQMTSESKWTKACSHLHQHWLAFYDLREAKQGPNNSNHITRDVIFIICLLKFWKKMDFVKNRHFLLVNNPV